MTIQKLYKQFVEWVTKSEVRKKADEFLTARLELTFYYAVTVAVILFGSSFILYNTILSNLRHSLAEDLFIKLDPGVAQNILDRAQDILINRFLTIDLVIMFFVIFIGFLLTEETLKPIKLNMEKQKRFIADASHELRTPTAIIVSGIEVALANKKLDFTIAKKTLENTLEEMREFSKLSNNLLDISKDNNLEVKHESINISELIDLVVDKNKNLAKLKEINIDKKLESTGMIKGNKIELERVFYNILDNAIKYTPVGGNIKIADKIVSNKYVITIDDDGCGISNDVLGKIFDPFFRADSSRHTEGAGLGLTLSKKIIENHKGTISVKSELNKGTSVIISLPISS